jgi:hypothetical protein
MKALLKIIVVVILSLAINSFAAPPTTKSVEKLLELTQAGKMMDSAFAQMDGIMKESMKQVTKGKPLSPEEQAIMDKQQAKIVAIMKEEFSWDKLKGPFVQIYSETFTQAEIDGLIKFYESSTGQAFVKKQPELMQHTMKVMQERMGPMMQKIQQMTEEMAKEMQAAKSDKAQK